MDKIIRLIEEYNNSDDSLNNEFELEITSEQILFYLNDFILNKEDGCFYSNSGYKGYRLKGGQTSIYNSPLEDDNYIHCYCCDCLVEETEVVYDRQYGMICKDCADYLLETYGLEVKGAVTF